MSWCRPRPGQGLLLSPVAPLALCAVLGGCASTSVGPQSRGAPASPAEGRSELQQLERQIADSRAALGLPPRPLDQQRLTDKKSAELDEEASSPAAPPAQAPAPERKTEVAAGGADGTSARREACSADPCRYTRAICDAASRICDIARYLGDSDAQGRCGRAQQDCAEARRVTRDRCPGC